MSRSHRSTAVRIDPDDPLAPTERATPVDITFRRSLQILTLGPKAKLAIKGTVEHPPTEPPPEPTTLTPKGDPHS